MQEQPEQPPAALLHAVFRRDEDAVEEIEAAAAQHGRDLRFGQVHVGHDIDGQAARLARARRGQQGGVGMHGPQLGRALGGRGSPLQRGLRVNFGERYFRMRAAGGGLGVQAALRKAGRGFARALHQAEHIGRAGRIPEQKRIEHIKSDRPAGTGGLQKDVEETLFFHCGSDDGASAGTGGAKRTPAAKPPQMMPRR